MQVWLEVIDGPSAGQKIHLRGGQMATFGRSEWSDFCFSDDTEMDDSQFSIAVAHTGASVRHTSRRVKTLVNDQAAEQTALKDGDTIRAGRTALRVHVEGQLPQSESAAGSGDDSQTSPSTPDPLQTPRDMRALCEFLELDAGTRKLAENEQPPAELIAALDQQQAFFDALRIKAHILPKRDSIAWGAACIEESLGDQLAGPDRVAFQATKKWLDDPQDENRCAAGKAAEAASYNGPGALLALATFCTEGNIGHPDAPVEADERITGQCVASALILAANFDASSAAQDRCREFLATAE